MLDWATRSRKHCAVAVVTVWALVYAALYVIVDFRF